MEACRERTLTQVLEAKLGSREVTIQEADTYMSDTYKQNRAILGDVIRTGVGVGQQEET